MFNMPQELADEAAAHPEFFRPPVDQDATVFVLAVEDQPDDKAWVRPGEVATATRYVSSDNEFAEDYELGRLWVSAGPGRGQLVEAWAIVTEKMDEIPPGGRILMLDGEYAGTVQRRARSEGVEWSEPDEDGARHGVIHVTMVAQVERVALLPAEAGEVPR